MTFQESLKKFLDAVRSKDQDAAFKFVARETPIRVILPDGKTFLDYDSFFDSQITWFGSSEGRFSYEIIETSESGDMGWAVVVATLNFSGSIREINITFVFKKIDGSWVMIYDQNTYLA